MVDDKWLAALDARIHGELDGASQALTRRIKELADCYDAPMPTLMRRAAELEASVADRLKRMGFSWS